MTTIIIVIGLVIIAAIYVAVQFVSHSNKLPTIEKTPLIYKYRRKDHIMTASEDTFFKMLIQVAGDRYFVFPQIHLSAILDHKVVGQDWKPAFRHINGKSVDFVLCDKSTLKPMYAVELDDSSHNLEDRKERDIEVERIFQDAGLPLVRFTNYKTLTLEDIAKKFYEAKENI